METSVTLFILLGVISGGSHGTGVLPDSLVAAVGETVNFTTTVTPSQTPFILVQWDFNDIDGFDSNIITSSTEDTIQPAYKGRVTLFRSTGSLELRNVTLFDNGEYSLNIIPMGAALQIGKCKLVTYVPISNVVATLTHTDTVEHSSVGLTCSSAGSHQSFRWMNGSSELTASDRVSLSAGGSIVTIINVLRYDHGSFRCHVVNPYSEGTSEPVNLYVSYGPEKTNMTLSPSKEYYEEGSNILLSCSSDSRPAALFQWLLNGELLSETGPELSLINIQESGNYSCRAVNNKTLKYQTSLHSVITVLERASNVKVNATTTDILESSSGSVRLSCSSSGSSLSFLWLNSSSELTASDRVQLTDGGATLTILNVTRYDQGPFRCRAFNYFSNSTSDPVNLLIIYGPEKVDLTLSPSQEYYDEGSDVSLICSANCRPPALIQWFLNGELQSDTGAELRLINIQKSQSGNYSCQAFNSKTKRNQTSRPAAVSVRTSQVSNVVITPSSTDLSELSSSVNLSCSSTGSFPRFLWLNSSSPVNASDRVQLTDEGSTLTIFNVTRYDQGPFICHVFNNFSNYTSEPVTLRISFGPENTQLKVSPPQEYFKEGSNINLTCSADSRPAAQFTWRLNGELLTDTGPELRLMNVQKNHSGSYSCQAFNNKTLITETSKPAAVSVVEPVSDVVLTSNNTNLFELSSSARLSCSSSGSSLSFLWLNGSSEVTEGGRVQLTDGGATLTIRRLTRYDQGPFKCKVSNGIMSEVSAPVNLFIQYGPDSVAITAPDKVRVGDFTVLYCSAASVPPPEFTWLYDGKPTKTHEAAYVMKSIRSFDSGTFTCTAVNAVTGLRQSTSHKLTVSGM
ncbi:carcinoembryonic antigen-related cell adhesion molecule 5-like [Centropristis striata]|uniref:carcinoembryonic antigen-related cell adhesion molecule 5-like n=1 Tax=Centropristis striata TaxID=184440 RepID=UPI0027E17B0F|nr:carcinoembryonic antigen-related cell adhesion molecule 5-like [Centropristis striata]